MLVILGLFYFWLHLHQHQCAAVLVSTSTGPIVGFVQKYDNTSVNVFYGIPYATPPLGKLRFQFPIPINWTKPVYATQPPNSCYQGFDTSHTMGFPEVAVSTWNANTNVSEDCLYLNIWAPANKPGTLVPVLLWVFGGGFVTGSATLNIYDGLQFAASQNVIIVAIQYRLNAFGFLYLNTSTAPGNAGLADQQMALEWIYKNIAAFGGNPENITIFGESAGAASANFLMFMNYKKTKIFSAAIMESSSALCTWAFVPQQQLLNRSLLLAKCVGCPSTDINCLQNVDKDVLLNCQSAAAFVAEAQNPQILQFQFGPTVDYFGLLPGNPAELLAAGKYMKLPILLGLNENEGAYWLLYCVNTSLITYSMPADLTSYANYLSYITTITYPYPTASKSTIASDVQKIADAYLAWAPNCTGVPNCDVYLSLVEQLMGDTNFKCPTLEFGNYFANAGIPVYAYLFKQRTTNNPWPQWTGILHGDEIEYVFGKPIINKYPADEQKLSWLIQSAWATFAAKGDPTVKGYSNWPKFSASTGYRYVILNNKSALNDINVGYNMRNSQCNFLSTFPQFNQFALFGVQGVSTLAPPVTSAADASALCYQFITPCFAILVLFLFQ